MRRKSEKNKTKSPEPPVKTERPKRGRPSRKRKKSSSSEKNSEDDTSQSNTEVQPVVIPHADRRKSGEGTCEDDSVPVWQVKKSESSGDSGEIQKLKICLARPPSTPERPDRSPRARRRANHSSVESVSDTVEEKRRTRHRSRRNSGKDLVAEDPSEIEESGDKVGKPGESEDTGNKLSDADDSSNKPNETESSTDKLIEIADSNKSSDTEQCIKEPSKTEDPTNIPTDSQHFNNEPSVTETISKKPSEEDSVKKTSDSEDVSNTTEQLEDSNLEPSKSDASSCNKVQDTEEVSNKPVEAEDSSNKPFELDESEALNQSTACQDPKDAPKNTVAEPNVEIEINADGGDENAAHNSIEEKQVSETSADQESPIVQTTVADSEVPSQEKCGDHKDSEVAVSGSEVAVSGSEVALGGSDGKDEDVSDVKAEESGDHSEKVSKPDEPEPTDEVKEKSQEAIPTPCDLKDNIAAEPPKPVVSSTLEVNQVKESVSEASSTRKRRWGSRSFKSHKTASMSISTDSLKSLIPNVEPVSVDDVLLDVKPKEDVSAEPHEEKMKRNGKLHAADKYREREQEAAKSTPTHRKISVVSEDLPREQRSPTPSKHKSSAVLFISNLVRPFTIPQLKNLLLRTGKIVENGFWIDKIKSKCFVQYLTEDEAVETRHALHGVTWPVSNPKTLTVDFSSESAMRSAIDNCEDDKVVAVSGAGQHTKENNYKKENEPHEKRVVVREWDVGKGENKELRDDNFNNRLGGQGHAGYLRDQVDVDRNEKRKRRSHSPSPARKFKKKEDEAPSKLLDDLFRKTKATPCIYWLPLNAETILIKEEQRRKHMADHERRLEELRRVNEEQRASRHTYHASNRHR